MLKILYILLSRMGGITLIACIAWLGWENLGPTKPDAGAPRMELLHQEIPGIVEGLRSARGDIRRVALLHFENDPTDRFTDTLRDTIEKQGIFDLLDRTVSEKTYNLLNLRHPIYPDPEAAQKQGEWLRVAAVIHGTIHSWETTPDNTLLDVDIYLTDVETGAVIFNERFDSDIPDSILEVAVSTLPQNARRTSALQRLFAWVLLVLLLPIFTITFLRTMVRKNSNGTNAFILAIYGSADALLAWLLIGSILGGWISALLFIAAVTVAFLYNARIMVFALSLEEE
ncbi:MAG: hypothetical protein KAH38_03685 [Candidatus Hydrogenedentes bacterium]|nr:hypothetical protein [Candidatus Hydrogenedentota bacterium]